MGTTGSHIRICIDPLIFHTDINMLILSEFINFVIFSKIINFLKLAHCLNSLRLLKYKITIIRNDFSQFLLFMNKFLNTKRIITKIIKFPDMLIENGFLLFEGLAGEVEVF